MNYPEVVEIAGTEYALNTGYEYALASIACINDPDLGEIERAYGVIAILYKDEPEDMNEAIRLAIKYLQRGKEAKANGPERPRDMDYVQDMDYIRSSFRSDYGINLNENADLHWWEFCELLQGLTDTCILNRIRDLRTYDLTDVKDPKARSKIIQAQREVALANPLSDEDQDTLDDFYAQLKPEDL